jgi:hypothetical protein
LSSRFSQLWSKSIIDFSKKFLITIIIVFEQKKNHLLYHFNIFNQKTVVEHFGFQVDTAAVDAHHARRGDVSDVHELFNVVEFQIRIRDYRLLSHVFGYYEKRTAVHVVSQTLVVNTAEVFNVEQILHLLHHGQNKILESKVGCVYGVLDEALDRVDFVPIKAQL